MSSHGFRTLSTGGSTARRRATLATGGHHGGLVDRPARPVTSVLGSLVNSRFCRVAQRPAGNAYGPQKSGGGHRCLEAVRGTSDQALIADKLAHVGDKVDRRLSHA